MRLASDVRRFVSLETSLLKEMKTMLSGAAVASRPDRKQSMKKIMLFVAILGGSAGHAHAGEAYSDPSDSRVPGVMHDDSSMKLQMRDADPFQLRVPGVPARSAALPSVGGS